MQTIQSGVRGMSLLMQLNADRLIAIGVLIAALMLGSFIVS